MIFKTGIVVLTILLLFFAGCGQKGALYLPDDKTMHKQEKKKSVVTKPKQAQ